MKNSVIIFLLIISIVVNENSVNCDWQLVSSEIPYNRIFLSSLSSDMYLFGNCFVNKTSNSGNSWQTIYSPDSTSCINDVFFINGNTGWEIFDDNIYKTTDGGLNWNKITFYSGSDLSYIWFLDSSNGWLTNTMRRLYKTTNGGMNWLQQTSGNTFDKILFVDENTGWNIYWDSVYKTTNGGFNWDQIYTAPAIIESLYFINDLVGWGGCRSGKIISTTNGGLNWIISTSGFSNLKSVYFINNQTGWAAGMSGNLYKSTNGGVNWIAQITGDAVDFYNIKMVNETTGFLAGGKSANSGRSQVLYKTTNSGINWNNIKDGYNGNFRSVFFSSQNEVWITDLYGGLLKSTNAGESWKDVRFDNESKSDIYFINENTGWLLEGYFFDNTKIFKTVNGGINWNLQFSNNDLGASSLFFTDLSNGWATANNLSNNTGYVLKTSSGGASWVFVQLATTMVTSVYFINNNTGWVGSAGGNVWKTTNGGISWQPKTCVASNLIVRDVRFVNYYTGWAVGGSGSLQGFIAKTTNLGDTWINVYSNENICLYSISPINDNELSAMSQSYSNYISNSLLRTTNGGLNWFFQPTPYPEMELNKISFYNSNTGIAVGWHGVILRTTDGGGLPISVRTISETVPLSFFLSQNYPNPFNPVTRIKFEIPEKTVVSLKVFDVLGRAVSVLVNEFKNPGIFETEFDGSNLSSGLYFYRLEIDNFTITKKMVLIK